MNTTHLPPSTMIHVEAQIPLSQRDEFNRAILEITAGARPRMDALERDLTALRGLDIELANACLDYLNYDRLGEKELHEHLTNGADDLKHWLKDHGIESALGEL